MFNVDKPSHLIRGEKSEQQACQYLLKQGLHLIEKNFRCKYGELDLIMRDAQALIIVEVRFRKSNQFGGAIESISRKKQSRIIATTQYYLSTHKIDSPVRFDVIAMSNDTDINWIKNAFQS
ncbi:MAG: YraN family protein [Methylococcaceae bacterium]|nr:YraN family protein [Methylococcaceae bacterium]